MESLEFHQFYCSILEQLTQLLLKGPFDPQIILYLVATRQEAMHKSSTTSTLSLSITFFVFSKMPHKNANYPR